MCCSCSALPWQCTFLHTLHAEAWGAKHYWPALHLLLHGRQAEEEFFLVPFSTVVNSILRVRILWQILLICPLEQIFLIGLRLLSLSHPPAEIGKTLPACSLPAGREQVLHFCHSQDSSIFRQCFTKLTSYPAVFCSQQEVVQSSITSLHW